MRGPATVKARLPTVESLTGGTRRRLVLAQRSVRRSGRSLLGYIEQSCITVDNILFSFSLEAYREAVLVRHRVGTKDFLLAWKMCDT